MILDGTMSSLAPGKETNAGLTYRLLHEVAKAAHISVRYEEGVQFMRWADAMDVIEGRGIEKQIRRSYGFIASRYKPGDRIFLFGYSRGAYAVRALAGMIDRIGLLKAEHSTVRNIRQVYRHWELSPESFAASAFAENYCHAEAPIEMIGVWDTVKSLGNRMPFFWWFSRRRQDYRDNLPGHSVKHAFHALALNESRVAFEPVLFASQPDMVTDIQQVWFRGSHGDIGGHLGGFEPARPLANIPLVWMLEKAEVCGLALPQGWRDRFVQDPSAPSVGTFQGWGKLFWLRKRRPVGLDPSESLHASVTGTKIKRSA